MTSITITQNAIHAKHLNSIAELMKAQLKSPEATANDLNDNTTTTDELDVATQHATQVLGQALANKPTLANNFLALASQPNPRLDDPRVQASVIGAINSTDDPKAQIKAVATLTHPELVAANANSSNNADPVIPAAYTDSSSSTSGDIKAMLANKNLNVLIIAMYVMLLLSDTDDSIIRQDSTTFNANTDAVNNINGAMDVYSDINQAIHDYQTANDGKTPDSLAALYNYAYGTTGDATLQSTLQNDLNNTLSAMGLTTTSAATISDMSSNMQDYTNKINIDIMSISPGLPQIKVMTTSPLKNAAEDISSITAGLKSAQTSGQSVSNKQSTQVQTDTTTLNNHISAALGMLTVLKTIISEMWRG